MTGQYKTVTVQSLTAQGFAAYGWVLGKPLADAGVAFANPLTDFRSEHVFDCGAAGQPEILWVSYRDSSPVLDMLEVHHLTEQAIVPLDGDVIHAVALGNAQGLPDRATLAAFHIRSGMGVCMRPGVWHATRVQADGEAAPCVRCLMLTRQSTTRELIVHLQGAGPAAESAMAAIAPIRITAIS